MLLHQIFLLILNLLSHWLSARDKVKHVILSLHSTFFSVCEFHATLKTVVRIRAHLNVWSFDISAAEFAQQEKRSSLV